jgi:hypothetical protein
MTYHDYKCNLQEILQGLTIFDKFIPQDLKGFMKLIEPIIVHYFYSFRDKYA